MGGHWGGWDGNFGESLGIPTGIVFGGQNAGGYNPCDFLACGGVASSSSGFLASPYPTGEGTTDSPYNFLSNVFWPFLPGVSALNNGTPWYHNSCIMSALKSGGISVGIDALGFLPEVGGVARVVGHQAGYVGKVADNLGKNMLTTGTKTTGVLSSATGFSSDDWTTWVSAGITAADFVPLLSDFTTPVAMAWDTGVAAYKVYQCPK